MLFLTVAAASRNRRKLRPWLLVASVFILGFMENSSLTIGNYMSIVALKTPTFFERPIWYVLVIGVFVVTLVWGRNFYCSWLCPFGAIQEGIYKALNLANYHPKPKLIATARKSRWIFLWLAAILALLFNNAGIASFEPFSVFFKGEGNASQWIIMGLILLFSIFMLRFWCRCFCPVGTLLDFIAIGKRKGQVLFRNHSSAQAVCPAQEAVQPASACGTYTACHRAENAQAEAYSPTDKVVGVAIGAIWILICGALLQNIGLF